MFNCDTDLYGEDIPEVMMGKLNFKESFARSCNRTFAELGNELMRLDKSVMETYLKALGGSGDVGWTGPVFHALKFKQLPEEKKLLFGGRKKIKEAIKQLHKLQLDKKMYEFRR